MRAAILWLAACGAAAPFPMFDPATGAVFHANPSASNCEFGLLSGAGGEPAALVNRFPGEAVRLSLHVTRVRDWAGRAPPPSGDHLGREDAVTLRVQLVF